MTEMVVCFIFETSTIGCTCTLQDARLKVSALVEPEVDGKLLHGSLMKIWSLLQAKEADEKWFLTPPYKTAYLEISQRGSEGILKMIESYLCGLCGDLELPGYHGRTILLQI